MVDVQPYNYPNYSSINYRRFSSDYFSGADIRIYFNDIWIDEVTHLDYVMAEQVAPIFGYASYTWDRIARGNRQVQGHFSINFKEAYYLLGVLEALNKNVESSTNGKNYVFNKKQFSKNVTIEQLMGDGNFESIADDYQSAFWGADSDSVTSSKVDKQNKTTYFYGTEDGLKQKGFNIVIAYGSLNAPGGSKTEETVQTLLNVQITDVSQQIGMDGTPVQEQYSFIAQDLNNNIAKN